MKRVVGSAKTASYKSSLLSKGGITGKKLEKDSVMVLDGSVEVTVKEQRILQNYTTVFDGDKEFEVATDRLTSKI